MGYYSRRKVSLLNRFDQTASLMREWLRDRYGADFAAALRQEIRNEFEQLILNIPYIPGPRARPLNAFLRIAAQELAVYRAMNQYGKPPAEAWELCHEALRRGAASIPPWQRWVMRRFMFSGLAKAIVARRARQQQRGRFGDFEIEYVARDGDTFHLGVNYLQCGILNFVRQHGGGRICPVHLHVRYCLE